MQQVKQAVQALRQGEIIAYPTEGVFGLGCDPFSETAVLRLLDLKQRPMEKGVILVASRLEQVSDYIVWPAIPDPIQQKMKASWPGAVTWVVPATEQVPVWVTGGRETVAIRVSAHPVVQALCEGFGGALVSTSANPSSAEPAENCEQCKIYFQDAVAVCIEAPLGQLGQLRQPTPIFDALSGQQLR